MPDNSKKLRLCFVADIRSPISQNWIRFFINKGHDVCIVSTFPSIYKTFEGAGIMTVPIGLNVLRRARGQNMTAMNDSGLQPNKSAFISMIRELLQNVAIELQESLIAPASVYFQSRKLKRFLKRFKPDLIHAMRIPFEGILASYAAERFPLLVSTWGNDLTLHAAKGYLIGRQTKFCLKRADALHSDTKRDVRLSREQGFDAGKPVIVLPGSGGVQADVFHPGTVPPEMKVKWGIPEASSVVIYPRRLRPKSVCAREFFEAVSIVKSKGHDIFVLCPGLEGNAVVQGWIEKFEVNGQVRLLPELTRNEMADLFRLGDITVSPSVHDGTPNTLLEAVACGCFPVAGNIESINEWIVDEENGLLCDARSPVSQAMAVIKALEDKASRDKAVSLNREIITQRAEYDMVMGQAESFYRSIINK